MISITRESIELAEDIVMETNGTLNEVVIFPTFTALESVADAIDGKHVGYGAQDLHWEDAGAYTGAISGAMIADICAEYVMVGHSERRALFGDNEAVVAKKMVAAYRNGLKPMLCVGENLEEREAGKTARKISMQLWTHYLEQQHWVILENIFRIMTRNIKGFLA